jgi:hypothetical protein
MKNDLPVVARLILMKGIFFRVEVLRFEFEIFKET